MYSVCTCALYIRVHVWTNLWKVWDRLDSKTLEDESERLYCHGVVLRERLVLENPHQRVDGNGRIEVL